MDLTVEFPEWVEPMAATRTQERFTSPEWIFERKVDGIRLLAFRSGSDVRLLSRNRLPQDCPRVARQVAARRRPAALRESAQVAFLARSWWRVSMAFRRGIGSRSVSRADHLPPE